MQVALRWLVCAALVAHLVGCLAPGKPVVAERSPVVKAPVVRTSSGGVRVYTVRAGDTLYSIAWRFELDYQGLARANGIAAPYVIRPGRKMRLITQMPVSQRAVSKSARAASEKAPSATTPTTNSKAGPGRWRWPLPGRPTSEYSSRSKGVDFGLQPGTRAELVAAGAGEVVYAANGIGGFERLVIIKHTSALLSAYGFNGQLRVKEGEQVAPGAPIANLSSRSTAQVALHFELRENGQPVNPRSYLP
jgi:lipoprotein NlpD